MPRYALKIEYNGDGFCGWQRQNDQRTVQGEVEAALRIIDPSVEGIIAAGRTDTGVHALGQVAHVDLAKDWKPEKIMGAVNYHLRHVRVSIIAVAPVAEDWSARFSAGERQYLFRLVCRRGPLSHDAGLAWRIGHQLDVPAMRIGAGHLIGLHDFTTFRSTHCQAASPVKTIDEITITEHDYPNGAEIRFFLRARSFLHNQVRSIVGSLERVGSGGWAPDRMATALAAKQRSACGPVCPPDGLYLSHVVYEDDPF